jgi:uncharacterized protein YbjT (DUF2867 family)
MSPPQPMTLVVGATGRLGFEVCARLRGRGVPVRAMVRPGSPRESDLMGLGASIVRGDLTDPPSLDRACRAVACVVCTASAMRSRKKSDSLKSVDRDGCYSLVRAAKEAGVEHFVFTSIASEANPAAVLVRCKRRVERVVRESGMPWTVLQPAAFMESFFSPSSGWEIAGGRVRIVGRGTALFNPVSRSDVAEFAALSVVRDDLRRRVIPIGGPDILSALDAVALFEEATGRKLEVMHASAALLGLRARLLRPFDARRSSLYALAAGAGRDGVVDMGLVLAEMPVEMTTLRQFAVRHFLDPR